MKDTVKDSEIAERLKTGPMLGAHKPDLPHGFIQMTAHSKRCPEATKEFAELLGDALRSRFCGRR